jgi:hypothetical protein
MSALTFTAIIDIIIGNPFVTPPKHVLESIFQQAGKDRGVIRIKGELNGVPYTQTLVRYAGEWRLYLNGIMLRKAGVVFKTGAIAAVVGTPVTISVEFDAKSRKLPMHPALAKALATDQPAKFAYQKLAPYRKHEILRYLGFLKTPESIQKNITRIMQHLRCEPADALHALMHKKKPH